MLLGGWIRKRRKVQQLDEKETHKKPRTSAPSDQHDQEGCPGGPCHHVGGGAPLQQRNTRARVTPDKGGEGMNPAGWKNEDETNLTEEDVKEGSPDGWKDERTLDEPNTDDNGGGPGHQHGGGAPLEQTNTRACVLTDSTLREGWNALEGSITKSKRSSQQEGRHHRPPQNQKSRQHQPKPKLKTKPGSVMNLAWLSYWWKRMEREASKDSADRMERKEGERLLGYFASLSSLPGTQQSGSVDTLNSGDVVQERHQVMDKICERHPATNLLHGQGSILRGSKRYVPGEISSPSKRRRGSGDDLELENPVTTLRTGRKSNNNEAKITQTINPQSEIHQHTSSSTEFKCRDRAKAGDES